MVQTQARRFNGRTQPFEDLREFIEGFCAAAHVAERSQHRLILVIEELFANTVGHGYAGFGGTSELPIWLTLAAVDDGVRVLYEDASAAHDPLAHVVEPDYSGPVESWRIGGWGIPLVKKLTRDLRYERADDRNRIHFAVVAMLE